MGRVDVCQKNVGKISPLKSFTDFSLANMSQKDCFSLNPLISHTIRLYWSQARIFLKKGAEFAPPFHYCDISQKRYAQSVFPVKTPLLSPVRKEKFFRSPLVTAVRPKVKDIRGSILSSSPLRTAADVCKCNPRGGEKQVEKGEFLDGRGRHFPYVWCCFLKRDFISRYLQAR